MRVRAIFLDGAVLLVWTFQCLIYLGIFGFNILLGSGGVVFGLVFGVALALKQISSIEKNGEFRATIKTWAYALLIIIIFVLSYIYLLFSLESEAVIQIFSFAYLALFVLYATRIILYLNWERKHRRLIFSDGLVFTRVYSVPRTQRR
jgi:hypothetical protein